MFKEPLERTQQRGGPILSHEDIKSIFSNIHEILSVHRKLVVRYSLGVRERTVVLLLYQTSRYVEFLDAI